jgi:hypothetical protein
MTFVEEAQQVHKIAQALSTTSFVPASMKNKPDEITGAILFGRELGMDPMTALQTINVIQGRPTLTANAMRGLAMASGVRFRLDETTETRCTMSAIAPGAAEWTTVTWTIDQARKLDLTKKDNWKNQPGTMLIARATSQLCRFVAANVLIGAPYSSEELRDLPTGDEQGQPVLADDKPKAKVIRRKVEPYKGMEPEPTPELTTGTAALPEPHDNSAVPAYEKNVQEIGYSQADDEKRTGPEEPIERPDAITDTTRTALMAAFNNQRMRDRNTRLGVVSKILGREVFTVNQITEAEGRTVLSALSEDGWPTPIEIPQ